MFQNCITIWNSAWCFVSEDFGTMNGPGRSGYECMRSQKESTKQDIAHIPIESNQFCNSSFLPLPPIYSSCTRLSETIWTNKASIEGQINRLSRDNLICWIQIQDKRDIIDQTRVALLFLKGVDSILFICHLCSLFSYYSFCNAWLFIISSFTLESEPYSIYELSAHP